MLLPLHLQRGLLLVSSLPLSGGEQGKVPVVTPGERDSLQGEGALPLPCHSKWNAGPWNADGATVGPLCYGAPRDSGLNSTLFPPLLSSFQMPQRLEIPFLAGSVTSGPEGSKLSV